MDDTRPCETCGQLRPYPMSEGKWRYRVAPGAFWTNVTVKMVQNGTEMALTITPDGESEPIWWPNNARWEKIED